MSLNRIGVALIAALALTLFGAGAPEPDRFDTVVIDPGHGGEDEGARGSGGLAEKKLVLDVATRLADRLRAKGLRVVMTRTEDAFVPLEERTAIANDARGDLFLSIHANAARNRDARGIETYFLSLDTSDDEARRVAARENAAFEQSVPAAAALDDPLVAILGDLIATEHLMESDEFARLTEARLRRDTASRSRGVKQAPFVVLMGVQMPASLVEIGFLTNRDDERALRGDQRRDRIVSALSGAILEFRDRFDGRRGIRSGDTTATGGR